MINTTTTDTKQNSLLFFKEVAKYFMDFLETDFHKHKSPRRSVKFRNSDNLLIGLNLQKYPSFNRLVSKLISRGFEKDIISRIEKDLYRTNLPKNLLDLIKLQIGKITAAQVSGVIANIANEIESASVLYAKEYDVALTNSIEGASKVIRSEFVKQFIESIETPLQNLNLGDEDNVYLIEEELVSVILRLLENKISEALNLLIAQEKINLIKELKSVFSLQDVKGNLISFFENLQVADLFLELFEMDRNKSILDKQDFYLYFGDISYNGTKYPIFYIPFTLVREGDALGLTFDAQVYINKKVLEFIAQEYNSQKGTKGNLQAISERIIYLAQHQEDFVQIANQVLVEISNFFEIPSKSDFFSGEPIIAKGASVRISNSCYVCLFDKSDEALVNDYEEILQQLSQEGGALSGIFNKLLDSFINKNPEPFNPSVEDEWGGTGTPDKLVYQSPIPLNSEQRQILSAINKDNCNYLIVEGPPGTGKSHTITAIIFDAILKNKSVLVLSDKKEALDVVEDKITQTMNKVRYDKNFQNPILRLGKIGNTYNSILAQSAIEGIKIHHKAVKKDYESVADTIQKTSNSLKEDLEAEILAYSEIDIREIQEFFDLELCYRDGNLIFDAEELLHRDEAAIELVELRTSLQKIRDGLFLDGSKILFEVLNIDPKAVKTLDDYEKVLGFLELTLGNVQKVAATFSDKLGVIGDFLRLSADDLPRLQEFIEGYSKLRIWGVGYLFTKGAAEEMDVSFRKNFIHSTFSRPHEQLQLIRNAHEIFSLIHQLDLSVRKESEERFDCVAVAHRVLANGDFAQIVQNFVGLKEDVASIRKAIENYPKTAERFCIGEEQVDCIADNEVINISESEFDRQIRYLNLKQKIGREFTHIPELNYATRMKQIEDLVTTQATYLLDGRLIDFYNNHKNDAQTLRTIIKNKQRFPKEEFGKLKDAFPCILAGIRDYAEYIPLESEIFDIVIIDEASQVSIAQAFPALLRAKKVLILGDKKQFSNIKAAQARGDINREYLNGLGASFRANISADAIKLERLKKFNIKTSILEFFEFISNYHIQLLKHFRGYKEIISYSNKYFYQESLQVMKIRGKSINDVIRFTFIEATPDDELYPNTNAKEVDFIISELKRLKAAGKVVSVGIITPHTNQQKLLVEMIGKMPEWDFFSNKMQLKIMTFDTCQGEERDVVYYSMVASSHSDKLWGVFIKDLSNVDIEEDGQIKAQRLNVGFSRAKECMHFVLSKPLDDFSGSIGGALRHYQCALDEAKMEHNVEEVDKKSKMEPEVLNWFYQTRFWKQNIKAIEFIPQFEIGKYLKQLDRMYMHPKYRVDFLLIYTDEQYKEYKIIIEYDGFNEHFGHFKDSGGINEFNYEDYYSDDDVYRQKVLESYGYKFLRINKFNIGENPIATLDERISLLVRSPENGHSLLANIRGTIKGLQNGEMRECPKCKNVKPVKDYQDESLITGYGRFCNECKNLKTNDVEGVTGRVPVLTNKKCPRCDSSMILRNGRKGKFYGCSRFPYCRGTVGV